MSWLLFVCGCMLRKWEMFQYLFLKQIYRRFLLKLKKSFVLPVEVGCTLTCLMLKKKRIRKNLYRALIDLLQYICKAFNFWLIFENLLFCEFINLCVIYTWISGKYLKMEMYKYNQKHAIFIWRTPKIMTSHIYINHKLVNYTLKKSIYHRFYSYNWKTGLNPSKKDETRYFYEKMCYILH